MPLRCGTELVVEVLSSGGKNEQRDGTASSTKNREIKLKLYSLHGVQEYWIVDWRSQQIEVYRRQDVRLQLMATLLSADRLTSPLLPGFDCAVESIFK